MFVRFRPTRTRLQVSLVDNRRADGKVKHEQTHADEGSVDTEYQQNRAQGSPIRLDRGDDHEESEESTHSHDDRDGLPQDLLPR